jgi:LPS export ABC transporter protein LptC
MSKFFYVSRGLYSLFFLIFSFFLGACSFDYGTTREGDDAKPDIVMENIEYIRVRGGDPTMRFRAELAERYEERQLMSLRNITFEQFENKGTEINALGRAGIGRVELDTGNVRLSDGVLMEVESEDIVIETSGLQWIDNEKQLYGEEDDEVEIHRSDGTKFTGRGFSANIRERTWEFTLGAEGSYVDNNDDDEEEEE